MGQLYKDGVQKHFSFSYRMVYSTHKNSVYTHIIEHFNLFTAHALHSIEYGHGHASLVGGRMAWL